MKAWLSVALILLSLTGGCRKASFKSVDNEDLKQVTTDTGSGDGTGTDTDGGSGTGDGDANPKPELIVNVPVAQILTGAQTTQATAQILNGPANPPVKWTVTADPGKDPGKIDDNGVYTSPATGTEKYPVQITATLISDPTVTATVPLNVVPVAMMPLELSVALPVPQLKVGANTTQATAELNNGTKNPPVTWSVSGPAGKDVGSINPTTGVYTSPKEGKDQFAVLITAVLVANQSIKDSASLIIVPMDMARAELIVSLPSPELKIGSQKIQATAKLKDGTMNPPVNWTVIAEPGKEAGTIDANGVYTSPASGNTKYPVIITATLKADSNVKASIPLTLIPGEMIFARCTKANVVFPIVADVFELPAATAKLPTDWKKARYKTTVCMDQYNVPKREFSTGFPDVPNLFEWFGLNTRTTLIVPKAGSYTLTLISDDGAKLWVDGNLKIDNDGQHGVTQKSVTMNLSAGEHPLVLDYFQGPRYHIALILKWTKPGSNESVVIPRENFK